QNERQAVAARYGAAAAAHGQQEVAGARRQRYDHAHGEDDGDGLKPPRGGGEDEVVSADHGVEHHLRPERQNPKRVGVDGLVQLLGKRVVRKPKRYGCKPHAYAHVHVVALYYGLRYGVLLIERQVRDYHQRDGPQEPAHDVPVGDVDLFYAPAGDGADEVVRHQHHARGEHQLHGPDELAVLLTGVVYAGHQQYVARQHGDVYQPQADPGQRVREQPVMAGSGHHVKRARQHGQRAPTPEHGVGMNRPQAPVRQPRYVLHVRRCEL